MRCGALVWIAAAGCSTVDSTALPSAVTGRYEYRYVDHVPAVTVPQDLSQTTFQVYVVDESVPGGFARFPAEGPVTGHADGTFEIDDVPAGPFWLREQQMNSWPLFLHELSHQVTWTAATLGRPDAVSVPYSATTPLTLDVTGLAPWSPSDYLVADCWGNATENYNVGGALIPPPTTGATTINASFSWNNSYSWGPTGQPYLMAATDGDFVLSRIANAAANGLTISTLTQVMTAPAIDQMEGVASTIRGTFSDVPLDRGLSITVDTAPFASTLPLGNVVTSMNVSLLAGPGSADGLALGPYLYAATTTNTTMPLNVNASYGDPFDPAWPVRAFAYVNLQQPMLDVTSQWGVLSSVTVLEGSSFVFVPPPLPQQPTLDGIPLDGRPIAWDGVSPLDLELHVSGGAQSVYLMGANAAGSTDGFLAAIVSEGDGSLIIPPELVHTGNTYALRLGVDDKIASASFVMTPPFTLTAK